MDVRATEESMVQRLRLGESQNTDEAIQQKLNEVFDQGQPDSCGGHNNSAQANSFNSFNSFSRSVLFATRATITLESELKREIRVGYDTDTRWSDIVE